MKETSRYYIPETGQWRCLEYPNKECRQEYCGYCGPCVPCQPTEQSIINEVVIKRLKRWT